MSRSGGSGSKPQLDMRIHIGYPRTGTTFLQRWVLPHVRDQLNIATLLTTGDLRYLTYFFEFPRNLGESPYKKGYVSTSWKEGMDEATLWERISDYLDKDCRRLHKPFLLSNENLTGPTFYCDHLYEPELIARVFPDAKIFICIRSQYTIIPSTFSYNYATAGTWPSYSRFTERIVENEKFQYDKLITRYQAVFGDGAVTIVLFEDLTNVPNEFVTTFLQFAGIEDPEGLAPMISAPPETNEAERVLSRAMNARRTPFAALSEMLINKLLLYDLVDLPNRRSLREHNWRTKPKHFLQRGVRKLERLNDRLHLVKPRPFESHLDTNRLIADAYRAGNRQLSSMLGRDLGSLGYPV